MNSPNAVFSIATSTKRTNCGSKYRFKNLLITIQL